MAKFVHSMIRVLDGPRSIAFYERAFGLAVADRYEFADFTLVYMRNAAADYELELTVNHGRTEPYELGNGYGHSAFVVDDLDAEHARFTRENLAPGQIREMQHGGALMAKFFFVTDPDGYKIEVLQRHGRFR